MGFWNSLTNKIGRGERKAYTLTDPAVSEVFGIRSTMSGVHVGGMSALSVPAVLQAVRLISETIGSLPVKLYRETGDEKQIAKDHTAHRIVHYRGNEWTGAATLRTEITADALIYGNGFAKVVRFDDGRPFELIRLLPGTVSIQEDSLGASPPVYRVSEAGGSREYAHTEILHIQSFLKRSPISFGREAIGLAAILEKHGSKFFANGTRPNAIISNEKPQGGDAGAKTIANIRKSFLNWMSGTSGEPLIMDGGWKYEAPALTSTDAQYVENRLEQINEIARIFGVPPHMLYQLDRATWSNAEQMGATFLQLCLRPWLDRWQEALATVLLSEDEQDSHWFEFTTDDLMRTDAASRTENLTKLIAARVLTANEARAILNMPPVPGGDELINPNTTTAQLTPARQEASE